MNSRPSQQQTESTISDSHPAGWPSEVVSLFQRAITTEYASLTARGAPLTYPVTPYIAEAGRTLDVSTGLTIPARPSAPGATRRWRCSSPTRSVRA
jgi:hypothetical protein